MTLRQETLIFDGQIYSVDTIQKSGYRFIDRLSVDIRKSGSDILCVVTLDHRLGDASAESCIQDFKKEVLDQHLRAKIREETEPVRNLILAYAFSKSGLQGSE